MLALDDHALAHLFIAASGVAPADRKAWLQDLAEQFEAPANSGKITPGARYTRAWRARARNGQVLLRVTVDEAAFVVAAVEHDLLDPLYADDCGALTAAAQRVIMMFCEGEVSPPQLGFRDRLQVKLLDAVRRRSALGKKLSRSDLKGARASTRRRQQPK